MFFTYLCQIVALVKTQKQTSMNIGYDAKRVMSNKTGLGSYGRNLVNALVEHLNTNDKLVLYAPKKGNAQLVGQLKLTAKVSVVYPLGFIAKRLSALWRVFGLTKVLVKDKIDVFHGLSGELPMGIKSTSIASIVTIHDLIFLRCPQFYHFFDVLIYKWKFLKACQQADKIVAISERTKQDIMHYGAVPEHKIKVIYQPCACNFSDNISSETLQEVSCKYALPQRFILNVGTIEERKNVLLALKALTHLPQDVHLVIVGRNTHYTKKVVCYAKKHDLTSRLHILNNVTNEELPAIYKLSQCFVYPSRYEGFGLPIIEAIQCGCAVVACIGSCLEEAGGKYSLYVNPDDVLGMANAVLYWLNNPEEKAKSIALSREYVKRFENNDMALQLKNLYQEVLNEKTKA